MNIKEKTWSSEHDDPNYWKIVNLEIKNPNTQISDDLTQAYKIANEQYEASRERFKKKREELAANDFSINTSKKKTITKKTIVVPSTIQKGRILPDRQILFDKQNGLCPLCKLPLKSALTGSTIDHIQPRSRGGSNDISNKQLTHSLCNNIKGDSTEYISPARFRDLTTELKEKIRAKQYKRRLSNGR